MRLCLFSDIHANLFALEACLSHAKNQGISQYAFLGDYIGYGAQPKEVMDIVMSMVADGAFAIKGNHDELTPNLLSAPKIMKENKTMGSLSSIWSFDQLSKNQKKFLDKLPLTKKWEDLLLVHASADSPAKWRYVDSLLNAKFCMEAAIKDFGISHVFVGHYHGQKLYYQGRGQDLMTFIPTPDIPLPCPLYRKWIATVGSVGQPRDGDPRAMYAIYDQKLEKLIFHRVHYDYEAAAKTIRLAGLPQFFADRLEVGR